MTLPRNECEGATCWDPVGSQGRREASPGRVSHWGCRRALQLRMEAERTLSLGASLQNRTDLWASPATGSCAPWWQPGPCTREPGPHSRKETIDPQGQKQGFRRSLALRNQGLRWLGSVFQSRVPGGQGAQQGPERTACVRTPTSGAPLVVVHV